jgi:hypothetical protein
MAMRAIGAFVGAIIICIILIGIDRQYGTSAAVAMLAIMVATAYFITKDNSK